MNGAQPPTCSMWVLAGPFPPPPLTHPSHSELIHSDLSSPHTPLHSFTALLTLSHTIIFSTKVNPLSQHSLTGNVLYKFVLQLCYIFIVLCYYNIGNIFFFLLVYILLLFARFKKKKFNIMINDWEYLVEIL